jgi:chorismate dehydratase
MKQPQEDPPKLRMAPAETPEELAHRVEREQRAEQLQREGELEDSLKPFRVGSVGYLNAAPLVRGLENELVIATPARLAEMLQKDELDAGLVSLTEVLFNDRYDVLDSIAIASLGEVKSVLLGHKRPLEETKEIFCDTASLTSVNLLRVLLGERGLNAEFKPLPDYQSAEKLDAVLLIGDSALDFQRAQTGHEIFDLGTEWLTLTGLPFVYAVWALRRGVENSRLRRQLREARDFGLDTLDHIIQTRPEYDFEFRKDYLGWHIHYHLGGDEKRGIARFIELLRKHGTAQVFEPKFVV